MDEATENLDIMLEAGPDETPEAPLSADDLNLDGAAAFNLEDVLDNPEAASSESLLNLAGEEESTADLNMEDWLAGISSGSEVDTAGDIGLPDGEFGGDAAVNADEENNPVAEEEAPEAAVADEVGGWLAEDSSAEVKDTPEEGNSWLAEAEEVSDPVADTEEPSSSIGGGWLAETETNEAEFAAASEDEQEENAVAANSWLPSEETAGEVSEPEVSVVADAENETDGMPADESEAVTESTWLSSENDSIFEENVTDINAEVPSDSGETSGWDEEIPAAASVSGMPETVGGVQPQGICGTEPNFVKWYSGSVHDEMFEVSKNELPSEVEGSADKNIIHVNAGYDTYGWLVEFDEGPAMSLEDVRKYQIRNGALPAASGIIRYGANQCRFSGIDRILIYQSVRYFSYGA